MGDLYYPKYIRDHLGFCEFMGCIWAVSGYLESYDIAMDPKTPEIRRRIMIQRIEGIDKAAEFIPEECRKEILDSIIHDHTFSARKKKLHEPIVKFLTEIRDNVLYLGY